MNTNFNTEKIYEGIYSLFEDELLEIGNYISFTDANLKSYSNKIHELHLRICAEIENVLKIVTINYFIDKENIQSLWDEKKSRFLTQIGDEAVKEYTNLYNLINKKKEKDNLDKFLFGQPDFMFYFGLACEQINLNKKNLFFLLSMQTNASLSSITPFSFGSDSNIPKWWTNYNKLKHDKANNFDKCNLEDLINSLGGLYILMTYLLTYSKENFPKTEKDYWDNAKNNNLWDCDYFNYPSKVFKSSNSFQSEDLCLKQMPFQIYDFKFAEFREKLDINFRDDISINSIIKENAIFHIYFDYELSNSGIGCGVYYKRKYCIFNN